MSAYVPKGQENAINYQSKYVTKTEINKVPTQEKQAPNRKGNQSIKPANNFNGRMATGGATNESPNTIYVAQPKGAQGMPKVAGYGEVMNAKPDVVLVNQPKKDYKPTNLGYLKNNESKSWKS